PIYYIICGTEAASNLSRYDGIFYGNNIEIKNVDDLFTKVRSECFGEEVQRRIIIGKYMMYQGNMDGFYDKSRKIINKMWNNLKPMLDELDFVLMPASHGTAPTMEETMNPDPVKMYMEDLYLCFANLLGIPAIVIPMEKAKNNMPIGIQIISKPFGENLIFEGAKIIEKFTEYFEKHGGYHEI
ncbi:MAG: amidase family protein, partial [Bacteroidota bacterium]